MPHRHVSRPSQGAAVLARRRTASLLCLPLLASSLLAFSLLTGCGASLAPVAPPSEASTPAADSIGERLFIDTRFSEYFATHMSGVNDPLPGGDPAVATVATAAGQSLPGPFAGQSTNCRSCHFVTEFQGVAHAGNRTYADFNSRSLIPRPMSGFSATPRNSMQMVDSLTPGARFLHFDGEFSTPEDLVRSTLTTRNFGWLPTQAPQALAHIARVIREDNGTSQLAADRTHGLSYSTLFLGTDPRIPKDLALPAALRIDTTAATDEQILDTVAACISRYMRDLLFQRDQFGRYVGSPYDNFLRVNHLPQQPIAGESREQYNQRLYSQLLILKNPLFITTADGSFKYHENPYQFGALELAGLKIFLKSVAGGSPSSQHAGNCAACHQAPDFTDFLFHNTGVSQDEYDSLHGAGTFSRLHIPGLAERNADFDLYMPASARHPSASESLRHAPDSAHPSFADLGLWNIYLNPDKPNPQAALAAVVCAAGRDCSIDQGLASTIARFKTPVLRDLEDSAPYFHNGSRMSLDQVIEFYITSSRLARQGLLRNAPVEFVGMSISEDDVPALVAFLQALAEDYDDA